jgi:hypothetical protein
MAGDEVEHVIEKPDAGVVLELAGAVERQRHCDLRFRGSSIDNRSAAPP